MHAYICFVSPYHMHAHRCTSTRTHTHVNTHTGSVLEPEQVGRQSSSVACCSSVRIKPVIREMKGKLSFHIGLYTHHPQ